MTKLTKKEQRLLGLIALAPNGCAMDPDYPPAIALIEMGLAKWHFPLLNPTNFKLRVTAEGRERFERKEAA